MIIRSLLTVLVAAFFATFDPAPVEARAGKGSSFGATRSAPSVSPNRPPQRSPATTPQQARPATPGQQQPGFFQRNPFLGGVMGGLIGAGIGAALFGNFGDFFGEGFGGFLGAMLQIALIGGIIYLVVAFLRRRRQPEPAYATAGGAYRQGDEQPVETAAARSAAGAASVALAQVEIGPADYDAFTEILTEVQKAWSNGDMAAAGYLLSDEVRDHLAGQLAEDKAAGRRNVVSDVVLVKGDLDGSWREDGADWATVTMRWRALDYTVDAEGRVVEGSKTMPVEASERWTLVRRTGGGWRLAGIEQI